MRYDRGVFDHWGQFLSIFLKSFLILVVQLAGSNLWQYSLPGGITNGMLVEGTLYISSAITNWPIVADNIYQSYKNKTGHMRPFTEAVRPLVPLVLCYFVTYLWILVSPSNVVERDPRALFFLMGTIFSNISVSKTSQTFNTF